MPLSSLSPSGALLATVDQTSQALTIRRAATGAVVSRAVLPPPTAAGIDNPAGPTPTTSSALRSSSLSLCWLDETRVGVLLPPPTGCFNVYDVARGSVLAHSSRAPSADDDLCGAAVAVAGAEPGSYYLAGRTRHQKAVLYQHDAATGRLLRKIKVGRSAAAAPGRLTFSVTDDHAVLHCGDCVRIIALRTGEKVGKIKLGGAAENAASGAVAVAGSVGCAVHPTTGALLLFGVDTGDALPLAAAAAAATTGGSADATTIADLPDGTPVQMAAANENGTYWLLVGNDQLLRIRVDYDDDTVSYNVEQRCQLQINSSDPGIQVLLGSNVVVAVSLATAKVRTAVVSLDPESLPKTLVVSLDDTTATTKTAITAHDGDDDGVAKNRKKRQQVTVLGPGQAGGEAHGATEGTASKKRSLDETDDNDVDGDDDDDDDGPTIAERLAQLQQSLDAEDSDDDDNGNNNHEESTTPSPKFVPKHATTESLGLLLTQALQSADANLLEQALQVRDAATILATCRGLDAGNGGGLVEALLAALTTRLASGSQSAARAEHLVQWIAAVLHSHRIADVRHLQPLQNLLQERLDVFPLLLQLEGRLEHMASM